MLVVQYGQVPAKWESCVIWDRWRLVRGTELYDLTSDPGQETDLAARRPDVVQRMREHYEQWWAGVEPGLNDFEPISVGATQENPVYLSSSDWESIYCDNNRAVGQASGGPRGGPWNLLVERGGVYRIELRRWPFHTGEPLRSSGPRRTIYGRELPEGKPLPIAGARLVVADQDVTAEVAGTEEGIGSEVRLPAGRTKLHAWFQDEQGADLSGAFYARVEWTRE